jgi:hypothetical protein
MGGKYHDKVGGGHIWSIQAGYEGFTKKLGLESHAVWHQAQLVGHSVPYHTLYHSSWKKLANLKKKLTPKFIFQSKDV